MRKVRGTEARRKMVCGYWTFLDTSWTHFMSANLKEDKILKSHLFIWLTSSKQTKKTQIFCPPSLRDWRRLIHISFGKFSAEKLIFEAQLSSFFPLQLDQSSDDINGGHPGSEISAFVLHKYPVDVP